jgi:hypothetical protein
MKRYGTLARWAYYLGRKVQGHLKNSVLSWDITSSVQCKMLLLLCISIIITLILYSISLYLRRVDPPQAFTPYLEECVKTLEDSDDHPNDKAAVALVRLQGILERVRPHMVDW